MEGNQMKMREAVVLALSLLDLKEGVPYKTISQKDIDFMKAALSAPPRNCDVGTPEEQKFRQSKYCKQSSMGKGCSQCPLKDTLDCRFAWMQMPYAEEGSDR